MKHEMIVNDRTILAFKEIVDRNVQNYNIDITSIVLYGSRASGDRNSNSVYELLVLLKNDVMLAEYIKFNESLKLELIKEKLSGVKFISYTPDAFEELMYNDPSIGAILYIICKENIVLYDKLGTFAAIKEKVARSEVKDEEEFLNQCISFAKMLRSEKWQRKYEKALLQYKYIKRRKRN